jgi:threonine synthase
LGGLAPDGGLYVPEAWPARFADAAEAFRRLTYAEAVARVLAPFAAPWLGAEEIERVAAAAYAGFRHPDVAPTVAIGERLWMLELFHGPTLAFKDLAMQLLAALFERALAEDRAGATIICATSGDTGGAAVEAFRGKNGIRVVVLFPDGRISCVQRRMMTTAEEPNVLAIAVDGDFDDCQRIVKALLGDAPLKRRLRLTAVNSINWARLAIQIAYYFTSAAKVVAETGAPNVDFVVPTGNFGDAFAGVAAKRLGAPVGRILAAVNRNDVIRRALTTGSYRPGAVAPTISPSMDIEVASNFERMLYEASGRNPAPTARMMADLADRGAIEIDAKTLQAIADDVISECASEEETADAIRRRCSARADFIDPHTAVGFVAAGKARAAGLIAGEAVCLATAHAAKFPEAVEAAAGARPAPPAGFGALDRRPERYIKKPADASAIGAALNEFCG